MAKNQKIVRYRRPFHLNIGLIVFGIIFIYMMYYVYSYFTTDHISVYEVVHGTIAVNNSYTGLALREEEIVPASDSGDLNYYRKDATKAGVGDLVYSVDTDGAIARQIQQASADAAALSEESLYSLENAISEYVNGYRPENFYQIYNFKNDLNAELSESLGMEAINAISDSIAAAESNATFHKETSPKDGIVVYYTDGFEDVTTESFTSEMFDESAYTKTNLKERTKINAGEPAYKLITSEDWNLVFPIRGDTKRQLDNKSSVRIQFKKDGTVANASVEMVVKDEETYLILSLSHSMIRFASDRYVEIELLFDEETGLKIPNSAITKKDFFTIPMEYFQKGGNSSEEGVVVRKLNKDGTYTDSFVTLNIYYTTEYAHYTDHEELADGDIILKPKSNETYTIHETDELEGVYCINKGYAVFRQIDVIYQNAEYSIIRSGTNYGVSLYDHIALEGDIITDNAVIQLQK